MKFDEYNRFYLEAIQKYGPKTCVLYHMGSFYEIYDLVPDRYLNDIADILNFKIARSGTNSTTNRPFMIGIPVFTMNKHVMTLLSHGYTVVQYDQKDNLLGTKERVLAAVYSQSMPPMDNENNSSVDNTLMAIHKLDSELAVVITFCNDTNKLQVYNFYGEETETSIKELIVMVQPNELVYVTGLEQGLVEGGYPLTVTKISDMEREIRRIYKLGISFESCIEELGLIRHQHILPLLTWVLLYIEQHTSLYLNNLARPVLIENIDYLSLELNTLYQLNILGKTGSMYEIVSSFVTTTLGKRYLKYLLAHPYKSKQDIEQFHLQCETIDSVGTLKGVYDLEKIYRKFCMGTSVVQMVDIERFVSSFHVIGRLVEDKTLICAFNLNQDVIVRAKEILTFLTETVNESAPAPAGSGTAGSGTAGSETAGGPVRMFRMGMNSKLDDLYTQFDKVYSQLLEFESGLKCTSKEGFYYQTSLVKFNKLAKTHSDLQKVTNRETTVCKFTTQHARLASDLMDSIGTLQQSVLAQFLNDIVDLSKDAMGPLIRFVQTVDLAMANIAMSEKLCYTKPKVIELDGERVLQIKDLRHPIIESVSKHKKFIPNDVDFRGPKGGVVGAVLYGINSGGKTTLLRAVGLAVVLAQCGFYVPCTQMVFTPFDRIVSQVDLHDNMLEGQSSFVTEMIGLKHILKCADSRSLILVDELVKGTENLSATSLFMSTLRELTARGSFFVMTTHLYDLLKLDMPQGVGIFHFAIETNGEKITFLRKLQPGPPVNQMYGIEIAKALKIPTHFIQDAYENRCKLTGTGLLVSAKSSRFNKQKVIEKCEICSYTPVNKYDLPLDTHHIDFQCTANETGFIKHHHKHRLHNLVGLCKLCHIKVHKKELIINGYIDTTDGLILDYAPIHTRPLVCETSDCDTVKVHLN